ncbi:hypothetical protein B0H16DRAFT_1225813, partial [Mycena metata]
HFSKGHGAPTNTVHPHYIRKRHVARANHGQRIPWASKEITKDPEAYASLVDVLSGLVEYLANKMYLHRPGFTQELEAYVGILPHNAHCPWAPFGGIVVNLNACSDAHLDPLDLKKQCVVIPLMRDCIGAGLVLHEARLVLDLHSGDVVLFPSGRFTHYNLHY